MALDVIGQRSGNLPLTALHDSHDGLVVPAKCRSVVVLSENYSELINTICSGRYSPEQVVKIIDEAAYNPLTDDALCFQLMVKYEVQPWLDGDGSGNWCATINNEIGRDFSPNKAILLAIIEAHNE